MLSSTDPPEILLKELARVLEAWPGTSEELTEDLWWATLHRHDCHNKTEIAARAACLAKIETYPGGKKLIAREAKRVFGFPNYRTSLDRQRMILEECNLIICGERLEETVQMMFANKVTGLGKDQ